MDDEDQDNSIKKKQLLTYLTIPFILAVPPIVGWFIGSWLDKYFDTDPYLLYSLLILGFIAGWREFYRVLKNFSDHSL